MHSTGSSMSALWSLPWLSQAPWSSIMALWVLAAATILNILLYKFQYKFQKYITARWVQQEEVLAINFDDLSFIPRTYILGKNQLLKVVLTSTCM